MVRSYAYTSKVLFQSDYMVSPSS